MDFIEQIFGFSPDGGSGAFELLLFLIPIAGLVILYRRRSRARQERRR
jgi:cbb3-type cytochrome oxidase subunit 3